MSTETFPTNTDDARVPDNLRTMTKYEKHTWAIGTYSFLLAILYTLYHLPFFIDVTTQLFRTFFFLVALSGGFYIINKLWIQPWKELTEKEISISDKATAWTFYGAATTLFVLLFGFLIFGEPSVSRDTVLMFLIYTITIFMGIRFTLLAHLLRKERLANTKSPRPNSLPEGEGM